MSGDYKQQLAAGAERLQKLTVYLEIDKKKSEIAALEQEMAAAAFWDNKEQAQKVIAEVNARKSWVAAFDKLYKQYEDLSVLLELTAGESRESQDAELEPACAAFAQALEDLELRKMLSGADDSKNALLTIHPGAGGTESQDWAQMLMRMYQYWMEHHGFKGQVFDFQPGEEAGIKSVTIEVTGEFAYGFLKAESGIHRLVRISPFDANKRRHTSFVSVFVLPEIDDTINVDIREEDLHVDTYRASGAGGQHVNKTSSAVRITHEPTGIVVQCQTDRSQHKNRDNAMKMLRARLYEYYKKIEDEKLSKLTSVKKDISWGNQIRSYVFQPYTLVKDHRTDVEVGDVQKVMAGEIDVFIKAFLMAQQ
jgi:peptide chain release factor 2